MNRAAHTTVAVLGTVAGLAGVEHGIGEIRQAAQGRRDPGAVVIESWPDTPAFALLDGEPAMTVLPDLLVTGVLAILLALLFIVWAIWFTPRRYGGLGLMVISVALLLVGGGFGPPLIGLVLGATATRIHAPLTWWRTALPAGARRALAAFWPWSLGLCVLTWLLSFPGMVLLAHFGGVQESNVMFILAPAMFLFLFLTIAAAFARDAQGAGELPSRPHFAM
jgi:hypothetical protein